MNRALRMSLLVGQQNLLPNGGFNAGTAGWTATNATQSIVNGELELVAAGSTPYRSQSSNFTLTAGRRYRFTGRLYAGASNAILNSARISFFDAAGLVVQFVATGGNGVVRTMEHIYTCTLTGAAYMQAEVASGGAWGSAGDKAYFAGLRVVRA